MQDINNIDNDQSQARVDISRPAKFLKISNAKVGVMTFIASFAYCFVWFYKQWRALKKNDATYSKIRPFWRALFFPLFSFSFVKAAGKEIAALAREEGKTMPAASEVKYVPYFILAFFALLAALFIVDNDLIGRALGSGVAFLLIAAMVSLQRCVNVTLSNDMPSEGAVKAGDILSIFLLVIFMVLLLAASLFLSVFSGLFFRNLVIQCFESATISGQSVSNECMGISLDLPGPGQILRLEGRIGQERSSPAGADLALVFMGVATEDGAVQNLTNVDEAKQKILKEYGTDDNFLSHDLRRINDINFYCPRFKITEKPGEILTMCFFNRGEAIMGLASSGPDTAANKYIFNKFLQSLKIVDIED